MTLQNSSSKKYNLILFLYFFLTKLKWNEESIMIIKANKKPNNAKIEESNSF